MIAFHRQGIVALIWGDSGNAGARTYDLETDSVTDRQKRLSRGSGRCEGR